MTPEQLAAYRRCTGRAEPPKATAAEAWLVCGRRAGKSFVLALVAVFLAAFHSGVRTSPPASAAPCWFSPQTASRRASSCATSAGYSRACRCWRARSCERRPRASTSTTPRRSRWPRRATARPAATPSSRHSCDELAFWPSEESANPDYEVLDAIRPGMATVPGAMLLCASSPYARRAVGRAPTALRQGRRPGARVAGGNARHEPGGHCRPADRLVEATVRHLRCAGSISAV
jgi:hypothetical protein